MEVTDHRISIVRSHLPYASSVLTMLFITESNSEDTLEQLLVAYRTSPANTSLREIINNRKDHRNDRHS